jgi:hypothetical protein
MIDDNGSPASELVGFVETFGVASTVSLTGTLRKAYVGVLHTTRCNKL